MAQFYTGPRFWTQQGLREASQVTVKTSWYQDRKQWKEDMYQWADERGITIEWMGESTHTTDDDEWHEAHFYIPNEHDRMLFALRWA